MTAMKVRDLLERLKDTDLDAEIVMIVPWGYPTLLEQVDVGPDGITLSGRTEFDCGGMPYV